MTSVESNVNPNLLVAGLDAIKGEREAIPNVQFVDGFAEVEDEATIAHLRTFEWAGVLVPGEALDESEAPEEQAPAVEQVPEKRGPGRPKKSE